MSGFDLKEYLAQYDTICRAKFLKIYEFSSLERDFKFLGDGSRHLAARDVFKAFDPIRTPFATYWQRPDEKALDKELSHRRLKLGPLADAESETRG